MNSRMSVVQTVLVAAALAGLAQGALSQQPPQSVEVFKADGSLQCEASTSTGLDQMAKELTGAGISVLSMRKANDGLIHIALCGTSTGAVNVFQVDAGALEKARSLGF